MVPRCKTGAKVQQLQVSQVAHTSMNSANAEFSEQRECVRRSRELVPRIPENTPCKDFCASDPRNWFQGPLAKEQTEPLMRSKADAVPPAGVGWRDPVRAGCNRCWKEEITMQYNGG